jgi:hypothetical protein
MKIFLKPVLFSIVVLFTKPAVAQQRVWYVGLYFSGGSYQLYNKNDWNADPILIYPVTGKLNTRTVGATTTYTWNKHLGVNSGLLYQHCKQDFLAQKQPDSPDPLTYYSITDEFDYLKLPINFEYSTNNEAKHQLVASLGLQTSFLTDYMEHFLQKATGFYSEAEWHNKVLKHISETANNEYSTAFLYKRFLLGLSTRVSYRMKCNDGWLLEIGATGDYDFTNAENRMAKLTTTNAKLWSSAIKRSSYGGGIENRPNTHNVVWGIFISASIPIHIW